MENTENSPQSGTFVLPPASKALKEKESGPKPAQNAYAISMPEIFLAQNDLWFCRIRWIIIFIFTILSLLGNTTTILQQVGINGGPWLPWITVILTLGNMLFLIHIRFLGLPNRPGDGARSTARA